MTYQELITEYLDWKRLRVKDSSYSTYLYSLKKYGDLMEGDAHLLSNKEMGAIIDRLLFECGVRKRTAMNAMQMLKGLMRYLAESTEKPVPEYRYEWPKERDRKPLEFYTRDEVDRVLRQMEEQPTSAGLAVVLGITEGLRIGEMCGLRTDDVDIENGLLSVNRTVHRVYDGTKSRVTCGSTKTLDSNRTIPLQKEAKRWVVWQLEVRRKGEFLIGGAKPSEPRTLRNQMYRWLEGCGVRKLHPHALRHTYATQLLQAGVDIATVASLLGHHDATITMEVYVHSDREQQRKAMEKLYL